MKFLSQLVFGGLGGLSATGPMTVAMILLHRQLPNHQRFPLPPHEITSKLLHSERSSSDQPSAPFLTLANHFAYGATAGAIYGTAAHLQGSASAKGIAYGTIVWLVSYLGILPGFGILQSAAHHSLRRNLLMLSVHWLWGLFVGIFVSILLKDAESSRPALAGYSSLPKREVKNTGGR